MGGVIIILTRGMSKRLTYGIPARYRVILMERLGGLFFDGGCSCVGVFFAGHSGLYCCKSLVVSMLFLHGNEIPSIPHAYVRISASYNSMGYVFTEDF